MSRLFASLFMMLAISLSSTSVFAGAETDPGSVSSVGSILSKRVLLISDIDDTIKVSHILSLPGKVARVSDVTTPFTGMAQLYQWIINMNPQSTKLVYLSNAPERIAGVAAIRFSHEKFLKYNQFPQGQMILREDIKNQDHKIQAIRQLIENERPEVVILVGDNGEQDAEIYHQAFEEYRNLGIQIIPFIHQLYGTKVPAYVPDSLAYVGQPIFAEQFGFVTPIEIALELNEQAALSDAAVSWMIKNVNPYIVQEGSFKWGGLKPITFPFFLNCSDFVWRWKKTAELMPLIKRLDRQCN